MSTLTLGCTSSSSVLPVSAQARHFYLLLEVSGGEGARSLPSNLSFILDASDSMRIRLVTDQQFKELARNGQAQEVLTDGVPAYQITAISNELVARFPRRIDYVSEALIAASEYLRPVDTFSVVAFAGSAYCMIASSSGKERLRLHQAARELDYLKLGDATMMAEGIATAFDQLQRGKCNQPSGPACASRMILLTDGHTRNVSECYEWAKRARQEGITLTTMGIGSEFNEDLLIPLADMTGGHAHYIETPEKIPDVFRQELGSALRVSYRNVEIKLRLPNSIELRRAFRVLPELNSFDFGPNMDGSYSLLLGDYDPAEPVALLLEITIPPRPAGHYRLAQAVLTWDDLGDSPGDAPARRQSPRQDIVVSLSQVATTPFNGRVMNLVEKVTAYQMGTAAMEAAQQAARSADPKVKNAATLRLREAATRLIDMGEQGMANTIIHQANSLERSGMVDTNATKRFRYETRHLAQGTLDGE